MFFSEFVKNNSTDIEFNEDGNVLIDIDSSMLSGVTVDTYSTFTGESWQDDVIDYVSQFPEWLDYPVSDFTATFDIEWEDIEFTYDFRKLIQLLSEAAADSLVNHFDFISGYEIKGVFSPAAYNFATDSFNATWEIDPHEIDMLLGDSFDPQDIEDWARDEYQSRSGFSSNIPRYFDTEYAWAVIWATIQKILIDEDYDGLWDTLEFEHESYEESTQWEITESGYRKVYTAITGDEAPETITDENSLMEALPAYQSEVLF